MHRNTANDFKLTLKQCYCNLHHSVLTEVIPLLCNALDPVEYVRRCVLPKQYQLTKQDLPLYLNQSCRRKILSGIVGRVFYLHLLLYSSKFWLEMKKTVHSNTTQYPQLPTLQIDRIRTLQSLHGGNCFVFWQVHTCTMSIFVIFPTTEILHFKLAQYQVLYYSKIMLLLLLLFNI